MKFPVDHRIIGTRKSKNENDDYNENGIYKEFIKNNELLFEKKQLITEIRSNQYVWIIKLTNMNIKQYFLNLAYQIKKLILLYFSIFNQ